MHYGASVSEVADSTAASQVSVFKPALFTEHSNADKKKRRTVADSVANVGESVAYLGVNMDVACQEGRVPCQ